MQVRILSEVTTEELTELKLKRIYKPIELHYGMILRAERIAKKIYLEQIKIELKQRGVNKTQCTIARWERNFSCPTIEVIAIWASCLNLKMSIFIDSADYQLVRGDWLQKLKSLRKDRGIVREKMNKAIGVDPWMITLWEKGLKAPTESQLKDWAIAVGATARLVFERV